MSCSGYRLTSTQAGAVGGGQRPVATTGRCEAGLIPLRSAYGRQGRAEAGAGALEGSRRATIAPGGLILWVAHNAGWGQGRRARAHDLEWRAAPALQRQAMPDTG